MKGTLILVFFICFENYHNKMRKFVFLKVLSERNRLSSPLFRAIRQSPKLAGILILKKSNKWTAFEINFANF